MIAAIVLELRALRAGSLLNSSGTAVHGVWFRELSILDRSFTESLHASPSGPKPFALSPLMGLPHETTGVSRFKAGQVAYLRICTLYAPLSRMMPDWLNNLPDQLEIDGTWWQINAIFMNSEQHPDAGVTSYVGLRDVALTHEPVPDYWSFEFLTPTAFNGVNNTFPFPLPESLTVSWLSRWRAFSSDPDWPTYGSKELKDIARQFLVVEKYALHTSRVNFHKSSASGCLGNITFSARNMPPEPRRVLDALMHYAFYCGSGYKTTQGWGQTRLITDK